LGQWRWFIPRRGTEKYQRIYMGKGNIFLEICRIVLLFPILQSYALVFLVRLEQSLYVPSFPCQFLLDIQLHVDFYPPMRLPERFLITSSMESFTNSSWLVIVVLGQALFLSRWFFIWICYFCLLIVLCLELSFSWENCIGEYVQKLVFIKIFILKSLKQANMGKASGSSQS